MDAHVVAIGQGHVPSGLMSFSTYDPQTLADAVSAFFCAVAPYRSDAPPWFSPLKIMQYRAQGVPIVAPDIGDCSLLMEGWTMVSADNRSQWLGAIHEEMGKIPNNSAHLGVGQSLCALVGHQP